MTNHLDPAAPLIHAQNVACELLRAGLSAEYGASELTPEAVAVWLAPLTDEDKVRAVLFAVAQAGLFLRVIEESDRTGARAGDVLDALTEEGDPERFYLDFARDLAEKYR